MDGLDLLLPAVLTPAWWWSLGLGVGIGVLYSVASLLANRYAMRQDQQRFMLLVIGGMMARIAATLVLVALVLVLLPVQQVAFIGAFFGVFVIGLAVEVLSLHRGLQAARDS